MRGKVARKRRERESCTESCTDGWIRQLAESFCLDKFSRLFKFKKKVMGGHSAAPLVPTHRDNLLHIPLPAPREVVQLNKLWQVPFVDVEG